MQIIDHICSKTQFAFYIIIAVIYVIVVDVSSSSDDLCSKSPQVPAAAATVICQAYCCL